MTPYEVMLSESQERMLVIVKQEHEDDVRALFERWELHCATIGVVTDDGVVRIRDGGDEVAARAGEAAHRPARVRPRGREAALARRSCRRSTSARCRTCAHCVRRQRSIDMTRDVLLELLASPEIASKRVGLAPVRPPGADEHRRRARAATPRCCASRARRRRSRSRRTATGVHATSTRSPAARSPSREAARNVVCTGARPVAMTDCLNFGNPEKLDVYFQLERGDPRHGGRLRDAGRARRSAATSSLYNETNGAAIYPTPVVGVLGLIEDVERVVPMGFQRCGRRRCRVYRDSRGV